MSYKRIEECRMADDYETAENFAQSRAIMAPFLGLLVLLMQQGIFFSWTGAAILWCRFSCGSPSR